MLCLDFVNSRQRRRSGGSTDRLDSYARLVNWARDAGALAEPEARRLLREAVRRPAAAAAVLDRGVTLREAIYRVVSAIADRRLARTSDLNVLNAEIAAAGGAMRLAPRGERFQWAWNATGAPLERPLWSVARSAGDVLASGLLSAVRQCPASDCGRLFLDRSRNRTRRWCDMRGCGNRAKARRYYARRRSRRARSAGGKS
jgi:predicted RNA-binding Zn ribbon-like protein